MSKRRSFTLRLSETDNQRLNQLAGCFESDRSTAVRRALRIALRSQITLPASGTFTPVNTPQSSLTIRLLPGGHHDG